MRFRDTFDAKRQASFVSRECTMATRHLGSVVLVALIAAPCTAQAPPTLDVWPGKAPGETGEIGAEHYQEVKPGQTKVKRLTNVSKPTITVYRPPQDKDTGAAVLICPGGGYSILAMDLEGEEVAAWLNSIGVTGIVLKYRVPGRKGQAPHALPLMDAQRAMSLVRSRAKDWGLDARRIGILGFSAGGHLAAATATNSDRRSYEAMDEIDQVSCRPDFAVLIYPAYLVRKGSGELSPEIRVNKDSPPTFFSHAADDPVTCESSIAMYLALKHAGVPVEMHVWARGGHGYGLRPAGPATTWPRHCEAWLRGRSILAANR